MKDVPIRTRGTRYASGDRPRTLSPGRRTGGRSGPWPSALTFVAAALLAGNPVFAAVSSSRALVLYNAQWTGDDPLTAEGQDSREVAELYVDRHTDPTTGEHPYLLGLTCRHGKGHLDGRRLIEDSTDNTSGVVLRRGGHLVGPAGDLRDSRYVAFRLPGHDDGWDTATLRVEVRPNRGESIPVVIDGRSRFPGRVAVRTTGPWTVRFDGRRFATGPLTVAVTCEDLRGEPYHWAAPYEDVFDVATTRTGMDGVRDDRNVLDDVVTPIRTFLEDPANARPDGTLLRDHVLYLVIAYGLPRTAAATYGIARGITGRLADHGADIALEQRLQLLFYDVEGALGFTPRPFEVVREDPFVPYLFRAPQVGALYGIEANPFVHPQLQGAKRGTPLEPSAAAPFTPTERARHPGRHLYFAMRLDGPDPRTAVDLVERAAYAIRHGPDPAPAPAPGKSAPTADPLALRLTRRGLHHFRPPSGGSRLADLGWLEPTPPYLHSEAVYLPGGIAGTVISHNGWNRPRAEMYDALARGVTVTAGAARVYAGSPHIHNHSWWSDDALYPCLDGGRTVGACLLENQLHLEWITSFVGDPLYRWPDEPVPDPTPPRPAGTVPVKVVSAPDGEGRPIVWLQVPLAPERGTPELAQMRAEDDAGRAVVSPVFSSRPAVALGPVDTVCGRSWALTLVDPAGNRTDLGMERLDCPE